MSCGTWNVRGAGVTDEGVVDMGPLGSVAVVELKFLFGAQQWNEIAPLFIVGKEGENAEGHEVQVMPEDY